MARDLQKEPLWTADDIGHPLPDSPHACSVSLPTWASVIGYEENDPAVTERMKAGYPRFFCHPQVMALFALAERELAAAGQKCLVFPTMASAERMVAFVSARRPLGVVKIVPWRGLAACVFIAEAYADFRYAWRLSGHVVSSRVAEKILAGEAVSPTATSPAHEMIRADLRQHTGSPHVFLFGSGMAAIYAVHRLAHQQWPRRRTVQFGFPYVDSLKLQQDFGCGAELISGTGLKSMTQLAEFLADEPIAGLFCEVPSNPLLETPHLAHLRGLADLIDFPLLVDDTVASVINVDAGRFADVVTTSLTKTYSGVGDVIAGAVVVHERSAWSDLFISALADEEAVAPLAPIDAEVLWANAQDFSSRVRQTNDTALRVARFLSLHAAVERVWYPGLHPTESYEAIRRPDGGYGPLISFTLKNENHAPAVYDHLRVCKGPSLGTNFTLACPYTLLAHYPELDWAESCGVRRDLIRVSIGLESAEELIARFAAALTQATSL
jgi:cystathionine gamma-synthase